MKLAVITGASRGIGKAVARRLDADGWQTALIYKKEGEAAQSLAAELKNDSRCYCCDVSDPEAVNLTAKKIKEDFGRIDLLVCNAGIAQQKLFTDITDSDWNHMLGTNLTGVFNMCRAVIPEMVRKKEGKIINVSSMWGQTGASCEVHYSAAKAGVIGLTKALAKELAPSGITVNAVAPGVISTDMLSGFSQAELEQLRQEIPLGRLGTPQDVADAVAFLSSEGASYITGQVLAVNGGIVI